MAACCCICQTELSQLSQYEAPRAGELCAALFYPSWFSLDDQRQPGCRKKPISSQQAAVHDMDLSYLAATWGFVLMWRLPDWKAKWSESSNSTRIFIKAETSSASQIVSGGQSQISETVLESFNHTLSWPQPFLKPYLKKYCVKPCTILEWRTKISPRRSLMTVVGRLVSWFIIGKLVAKLCKICMVVETA